MSIGRRVTALAAAGAVAATAVMGLSSLGASAATQQLRSQAASQWTIGVSNGYFGNTARVEYEAELKAYAATSTVAQHIKKLVINNAGTSVAAQISAVDAMIAEHVNAIILDSNSLTGLNATIAAAHKAGIIVVAANDQVTSPLAYHVQTVGKSFGEAMASGLVSLMHGHGNIVVLRGIAGNAVDAAEASGFDSVFKQHSGVHVLATVYPQWDDAQAQTDMTSLLSRYNSIDGVFTEGGMEQGVVRAYAAVHAKFVPVSGTDENGFACQLKQYQGQGLTGVQVGTGIYAYALALETVLSVLEGKKVPRNIPLAWSTWNTKQSIAQCRANLSPGLFLQTEDLSAGINVTPATVNKYLR